MEDQTQKHIGGKYSNSVELIIYCPPSLRDEFVEFAKVEFGQKQWIALTHLLRTYKEARNISQMHVEIEELKDRIENLEEHYKEIRVEKPPRKVIKTMGGELEGE